MIASESTERGLSTYQLRRLLVREGRKCLWCGYWLEWDATADPADAEQVGDWNVEGDYGCDESPETTEEGTGGHLTREDVGAILRELSGGRL